MRYSFRTLLILLAIGPPLVAGAWFQSEVFLGIALMLAVFVIVPFAIAYAALLIGLPLALAIELVESFVNRHTKG